jgi:hypothetical protein
MSSQKNIALALAFLAVILIWVVLTFWPNASQKAAQIAPSASSVSASSPALK